jgi:DNA-binding CsgD family transcriptional regulator
MASDRLRPGDWRAAFRLLGEVREQGEDTVVWVRHMLSSLGGLTGAKVGFCGVALYTGNARQRLVGIADVGWGCAAERSAYGEYKCRRAAEGREPFKRYTLPRWRSVFTVGGATLYGRRGWPRESAADSLRRAADVGHLLYSSSPLPRASGTFGVTLMRPWRGRPFTERQRRVLHLFHEELSRLWQVTTELPPGTVRLTPRMKQTLDLLCAGAAEKEVAARLGLSRHTVHDYVKALHERFGAASRGELLAAAARRARPFVPRVDPELLALDRS